MYSTRLMALALTTLISFSLPTWAQSSPAATLAPADESGHNPEFSRWLREFLVIVAKKDTKSLLERVDPQIRCSFGPCAGKDGFIKLWKLNTKPENSELWPVLENLLLLGGVFEKNGQGQQNFVLPYAFAKWPTQYDAFEYAAITGRNVQLRSKPSQTSPSLGTLNYDIVKIMPEPKVKTQVQGKTGIWQKVQVNGKTGYVWQSFIYSPVSYRAMFSQKQGKWVLEVLVAGD